MGELEHWRSFLLYLFADCFFYQLEEGKEFCCMMVDLMQCVAPSVLQQTMGPQKNGGAERTHFDTEFITRKVDNTVANYINAGNDPKRPIVTNLIVFMLDTVHQVPGNKSAKQKTRGRSAPSAASHMNQGVYEEMVNLGVAPDSLFMRVNDRAFLYPLNGNVVWRSTNLKLQLYRMVTHHVLHAQLKKGMHLLLDDGLAFSAKDYKRKREEMIKQEGLEKHSSFEQEFIIGQLITHSSDYITRFLLYDDGVFVRKPATQVGEADIKIQHYIRRGLGLKKFLVVNQDTDIIFILLLHMHTLLQGDESDEEYEVWLDTRCSNQSVAIKPYRYINVKKLYYSIITYFAQEFPTVIYPVETFCFLVFTMKTDFTRSFPKCLQLNDAFVWDVFSELHCDHLSFPTFHEKLGMSEQRSKERRCCAELSGLLSRAIQYQSVKRFFILKHDRISQFFYLLLQLKLMDIRKELSLTNGNYDLDRRKRLLLPAELLLYGRDVSERVEYYKRFLEEGEPQTIEDFFHGRGGGGKRPSPSVLEEEEEEEEGETKKFKLSSSLSKRTANPKLLSKGNRLSISIIPDPHDERIHMQWEEDEPPQFTKEGVLPPLTTQMRNYLQRNRVKFQAVVKRGDIVGEYFGLPLEEEMLARIYRMEWYLSYCRDGWRELMLCTETAKQDRSLSLWGWEKREVVEEEEIRGAMNSTYYQTSYNHKNPLLYQLSEVLETDKVFHRRYIQF